MSAFKHIALGLAIAEFVIHGGTFAIVALGATSLGIIGFVVGHSALKAYRTVREG